MPLHLHKRVGDTPFYFLCSNCEDLTESKARHWEGKVEAFAQKARTVHSTDDWALTWTHGQSHMHFSNLFNCRILWESQAITRQP